MLFKPELISKIVDGSKRQTRRLVKKMDYAVTNPINTNGITHVVGSSKLRWQVGRDYSVQPGRGRKGVYWCTECRSLTEGEECNRHGFWKPLRIRVTKIRKEKLIDITYEDAKAEGFESELLFYDYVCNLYGHGFKGRTDVAWNPGVWVISFSILK